MERPSSSAPHRWLQRWLRPKSRAETPCGGEPDVATSAEIEDPRIRRRRQVLADMSSFLLTHGLEINAATLDIAHRLIAATDPALNRRIWDRVDAGEPISTEWLMANAPGPCEACSPRQQQRLIDTVETTLRQFTETAGDARTATNACSTALEVHASGLEGDSAVAVTQIESILQDMLRRTRKLEADLDRSERASRSLEKRLVAARREAEIDHLTGLPNRRAFEAVFAREVELAAQNGEPLCVAFCDIDHFKQVNDEHGHDAGDRVLRSVAGVFASLSDDTCHVARHGGEEFVAILRGRTLDQAFALLDAARSDLATRRFVNRASDRPFGQITFSAGVAEVGAYSEVRTALRAADRALLAAKRAGRNRVARAASIPQANIAADP